MKANPLFNLDEAKMILANPPGSQMNEEGEGSKEIEIPDELPIIPIHETTLYPKMILPLMVSQEPLIKLIDAALISNKLVGIVAIKTREKEKKVAPEDLYAIGCAAYILKMIKVPNNSIRLLIQGTSRIRVTEYTQREPYLRAKVVPLKEEVDERGDTQALLVGFKAIFQKVVELTPNLPAELAIVAMNLDEPGALADLAASSLNVPLKDKQEVLETLNVRSRLEKVNVLLTKELSVL